MKIYVLDLETDPFLYGRYPAPFCADIFDGEEHVTYWGTDCVQRALLWLYEKPGYCYAHNGGKFDFHFMLNYIEPGERVRIINGRVAEFKIGQMTFRDSLNIIPVGLGKYKKDTIDYSLMEVENREANKDEIIKYLHTDTESLYELVTAFIGEYGLHLTQAGAAMKYWQKLTGIKAPNSGPDYYSIFKPYYMGGRVECFEKGVITAPCEAYDINSAYPFAMLANHAWGMAYFTLENPPVSDLEKNTDHWQTAFFKIVAKSDGALPFRGERGKLIFPNDGLYRTYFCTGHELYAALQTDSIHVAEILSVIIHDDIINFDDYVYHFYNKRLEAKAIGDKKSDIFCKIFLNSLYGKFGANPDDYAEYRTADIELMEKLKLYGYNFCGTMGGNLLLERDLDIEKQRYFNVATAASITGYVRAYLWRALKNSKRPLYCDTDCIFAEKVNVTTGKNLGQWGFEGAYDYAAIAGKKLYAFHKTGAGDTREDFKTASKGVKLNPQEIIRVAKGDEIIYKRDVPSYSYNDIPTFVTRRVRMT